MYVAKNIQLALNSNHSLNQSRASCYIYSFQNIIGYLLLTDSSLHLITHNYYIVPNAFLPDIDGNCAKQLLFT